MKCHDVEQQVDRYLDRELSDSEAREFESHLQDCESCREQYGALVRFLSTKTDIAIPDGLRGRIFDSMEEKKHRKINWFGRVIRVGSAAALIGLTFWVGNRIVGRESRSPVVEEVEVKVSGPPNPWVVMGMVQSLVGSAGGNPGYVLAQATPMDRAVKAMIERASQPLVRVRYRTRPTTPVVREVPISGVDLRIFSWLNGL